MNRTSDPRPTRRDDPELALLGRLVRLARRQNRYLRRHDADRLLANAAEWERHLAAWEQWRREHPDAGDGAGRPDADRRWAERRRLLAELARWNGHNARLARLGLELVETEAALLHPDVALPDGTYANDGSARRGIAGGTLSREA